MRYHQCDLVELTQTQPMLTTAWIEERGAKQGAIVEVKDYGKNFRVAKVYKKAFEADELTAKQARDRNAFGSLL